MHETTIAAPLVGSAPAFDPAAVIVGWPAGPTQRITAEIADVCPCPHGFTVTYTGYKGGASGTAFLPLPLPDGADEHLRTGRMCGLILQGIVIVGVGA